MNTARIEDTGYRRWQGALSAPIWSVWPIAWQTIQIAWKRKRVRRLFYFGQIPTLFALVALYAQAHPAMAKMLDLVAGDAVPKIFQGWAEFQFVVATLLAISFGADSIASDIRASAFPFYFTRPVAKWHYALGKCLGVFCALSPITWVAGILMVLLEWGVSGHTSLGYLIRIAAAGVMPIALLSVTIVGCSALLGHGRGATILFLVLGFGLSGLREGLVSHSTEAMDSWMSYISPAKNVEFFIEAMTFSRPVEWGWSAGIAIAVGLGVAAIAIRLRYTGAVR